MARIEWAGAARVLGWVIGVSLLLGAVLQLILAFELLGGPPDPPKPDLIDRTLDLFAWQQSQWPVIFTATAAFAVGLAGIGLLGPVIGRLADATDARRGLVSGAFMAMGGIGLASQLLWLGVFPVATSPEICDCGYRAEELVSREMILEVAGNVQTWLVVGALLLGALGTMVAGRLGREAGMPVSWEWLAIAISILSVALAGMAIVELYPYQQLLLALVAGVLVPIWALWLAMRANDVWGRSPREGNMELTDDPQS